MVAILNPLGPGRQIPVDRAVVVVGRSPDCDSVLDVSSKISRMHCALVQVDKAYYVRDLGSMNGVWVNGVRVEREARIENGARIAIGDVQYQFYENVQPGEKSPRKVSAADASQQFPVLIDEALPAQAMDDVIELVDLVEDDVIALDDSYQFDGDPAFADEIVVADVEEVVDSVDVIDVVEVVDLVDEDYPPVRHASDSARPAAYVEDVEIFDEIEVIDHVEVIEEIEVIDAVEVINGIEPIEVTEVEEFHDDVEIVDAVEVIDLVDVIEDVETIEDVQPDFRPRPRRPRR